MTFPSVDHGLLSPSGHVSKRARDAAMKRETERLFPPGYWDKPIPTQDEANAAKVLWLRRTAAELRAFAIRGMHVRKYPKIADALEVQADELERGADA